MKIKKTGKAYTALFLAAALTLTAAPEVYATNQTTVSGNDISASAKVTNMERHRETTEEIELPSANVLNVDFESGDGTDKSEMKNSFREVWKESGKLTVEDSAELNKKVANLYDYAYVYPFNQEKYAKITDAVTIECMFKYNEFWWGERGIFSNQSGGGIGLGVDGNGKLTFYAHVGGDYREPKADLQQGQWIHAVGVVEGNKVKLYVNGKLADLIETEEGTIKYPDHASAKNFVIGADSDSNDGAENYANVSVNFARIYDHALTGQEIRILGEKAFEGAAIPAPETQKVDLGIVTSDTAAANGEMDVNLHLSGEAAEKVDKLSWVLSYDPEKVTYCGAHNLMPGVTIDDNIAGALQIGFTGNIPTGDFREYAKNRIGVLDFETADVTGTAETVLETKDFHAYLKKEDVTFQMDSTQGKKTIAIYGEDSLDLNGDGVIGAGDVACAEDIETQKAIAEKAAIYPYKHAVVLTIDGGGMVWNPDAIYYAWSENDIPWKTSDAEIMKKRTNTYAMDLFNKEFATSYTAQSISPAISAQNYSSILHGIPWKDAQEDYQVTNDSSGQVYYADFGKETPQYPSMFRAAANASPKRHLAAFSEWENILNGIIEPDVPVKKTYSDSKQSFFDVEDYIRSSRYKNTALIYMQDDWMDHVGHSSGYFTDTYWSELNRYDDAYKAVIDALKETGTYEETLIIANADHGGNRRDHGDIYSTDMDVFIGLGGQTIDSGVRLQGGDNSDISALALYGLRMEKPASMTGEVFDKKAFLSQEEMIKKDRDIDCANFTCTGQNATLTLSKAKSDVCAADMVIELGNAQVKDIVVEGGTILRQMEENGELKLTIAYDEQPQVLAKFTFSGEVSNAVKIQEIMLGTLDGKEIYADLVNEYQANGNYTNKSELKAVIDMAEKLKATDYTQASYTALEQAITDAKAVYNTETASAEEILEQIAALCEAVSKLDFAGNSMYEELQKELAKKEAELSTLLQAYAVTEQELNEKIQAYEEIQGTVTSLTNELNEKKNELALLGQALAEAKSTLEQLKQDAEGKDTEIAGLKTQIQSLNDRLEKTQSEAESLETSLVEARTQVTALRAEKENLEKELTEVKEAVKSAEGKANAAKAELEAAKVELEAAQEKLKKKEQEAKAAQEEAKKALAELEKLKKAPTEDAAPHNGDTIEVNHVLYRVTDAQKKRAEAYGVSDTQLKKVKIASSVKLGGNIFQVTAISAKAFAGCRMLKTVTIEKNITAIGSKAFYKCRNLTNITFKGSKAPKIGKQSFKGIQTKCRITVSGKMAKKQFNAFKKRMKTDGAGKKAVYRKK